MFSWFRKKKETAENPAVEQTVSEATPKEEFIDETLFGEENSADKEEVSPEKVRLEQAQELQEYLPEVAQELSDQAPDQAKEAEENHNPPKAQEEEKGYFARLRAGLSKTRAGFADLFLGKKVLTQEIIDELEMRLLTADVGMEITDQIIQEVSAKLKRNELSDVEAVRKEVSQYMVDLLKPYQQPLNVETHQPFVILMVGINGAGKTTTIGKLARRFQNEGKKVMLAAGDTFRAAAVEQLQAWGQRNNVPVIAQATGADAASVAFDALQSAKAKGVDVLIVDTAGRLHTQDHLMEELKKIKRVLQKQDEHVPHETLLVLDAGNGQNALRQAQQFSQAMGVTGLVLSKLDGTAKGGIIFAITHQLKLPVRFIGVGEQAEDLRTFNAIDFVNALFYDDLKN